MHFLDKTAPQQLGQLLAIDVVVLVAVLADQSITPRFANHHALDGSVQLTPQPAGQWTFLNDQSSGPWHGLQDLPQSDNASLAAVALHHLARRVHHGNFAKVAMRVDTDKMTTLHRGLHALGFLATHNTASLPNAHHGRPDFFYLQSI